jgi:hypothetical protein
VPSRQDLLVTVAAGEVSGWTRGMVPRMRYLTPALSIPYRAQIGTAAARITAASHRRGTAGNHPDADNVPWCSSFSVSDRVISRANATHFCVITWLAPFSKVIVLRSSYNFTIEAMGKFLINQALICAQSLYNYTVGLKFRL